MKRQGSPLAALRTRRGLRQDDLARTLGISVGTLNRIERGRAPIPGSILLRLSEALGVHERVVRKAAKASRIAYLVEAATERDWITT